MSMRLRLLLSLLGQAKVSGQNGDHFNVQADENDTDNALGSGSIVFERAP